MDAVATYAYSLGLQVTPKTILMEGTTDVGLFKLAAQLEYEESGWQLLDSEFSIVSAGSGNSGGTAGVIRELICLRGLARTCLMANGRPRYRIIGVFDDDYSGRQAVKTITALDSSILEYKDVFRLRPIMPRTKNLDVVALKMLFERENGPYKGLDWELEDLVSAEFIKAFELENPGSVVRRPSVGGKTHTEFTGDGKARLHRFLTLHAMRTDVTAVLDVIRALRCYMGLKEMNGSRLPRGDL